MRSKAVQSKEQTAEERRKEIVGCLIEGINLLTPGGAKAAIEMVIQHDGWQQAFFEQEKIQKCSTREAVELALAVRAHFWAEYYSNFRNKVIALALKKLEEYQEGTCPEPSENLLVEIVMKFHGRSGADHFAEIAEKLLLNLIRKRRGAPSH
ncbi:MAG: hypothetical protein IPK84_02965 [Candidatus Moraniibacteriota bacterium]|nr:MAG: hypothetical protein IPK84_02965 [Candidatus Moranbacteria bacterium]